MMTDTAVLTEQDEKKELTQKGLKFLELAQGLEVKDDESHFNADKLFTEGAREIKSIENFINPHIKRANDAHKALTQDRAKMIEPIRQGKNLIGKKMIVYRDEVERKRKQEEARLAEEARIREQEAREAEEDRRLTEAQTLEDQGRHDEAGAVLDAPAPIPKQMVAPTPRTVVPKTNTSFRAKFEAEVLDKENVPEHFKIVDQGALNAFAQRTNGQVSIPGCKIVKKTITVSSTR